MIPLNFPEAPDGCTDSERRAYHAGIVAKIRAVLAATDEPEFLNKKYVWENVIHRLCWNQGLHPAMVLVALARERSILGHSNGPASDTDWERAAGVVGQQTAGTSNTLYDGFPEQLVLCVRTLAWLAGIGPRANFGYRPGLWPGAERWAGVPTQVRLLNLDGSFAKLQNCETVFEHVSWTYTPNVTKDMPVENDKLHAQFVAPYFP